MPGAGTQGTKGDEGSHTANPPPPHRGRKRGAEASGEAKMGCAPPRRPVPRLVPALCSQRACYGGQTTRAPLPPPSPPPSQEGDEDGEETAWGHGGGRRRDHMAGGRDERQAGGAPGSLNPALKLTNKVPERGKKAGGKQGTAGTWESRKERGKGETPR